MEPVFASLGYSFAPKLFRFRALPFFSCDETRGGRFGKFFPSEDFRGILSEGIYPGLAELA